jgi:aspartate ammonia-lyase
MSSFAEAFGRDRWRVFKCSERLRVLNLGGTAIGTGLAAPRRYIFKVVENLKQITGHSLARAENMIEATQNTDCFVEVSGMLNACASNLLKCASDLRFMSSGPDAGIGELHLPEVQAGSSIMPGKVNPVIPEAATQVAVKVISNNSIISTVSGMGNLELNAFMPLIADTLLESIQLLARACSSLSSSCVEGLTVNESVCGAHVDTASAVITSLLDRIGYAKAQEIILEAGKKNGKTVKDIILREKLMTEEEFDLAVSPESVTCLGSRKKTFSR